jgi:hypothetical protein
MWAFCSLAIDYSRAAATKRPRHADNEPEIVPTTAVVRLVDPHVGTEQTDDERDRRDEPVPKPGPEAGGRCSWDLESRAWSPHRQNIGHLRLVYENGWLTTTDNCAARSHYGARRLLCVCPFLRSSDLVAQGEEGCGPPKSAFANCGSPCSNFSRLLRE